VVPQKGVPSSQIVNPSSHHEPAQDPYGASPFGRELPAQINKDRRPGTDADAVIGPRAEALAAVEEHETQVEVAARVDCAAHDGV
jgi:hypothetical protein